MSAALGAALKKIAVALLTDRRNWEKLAVALFAVLLLFLLPILSVEAIFQADMDWDSPELVSTVLEELDVGSLGFLESSNSVLTQLQEALKAAGFAHPAAKRLKRGGLRIRRIPQGPGAILVGAVAFFGRIGFHRKVGGLLCPRPDQ